MRAPALIADPPGDTDVQIQVEVAEQRFLLAGKAMHHRGGQSVTEIPEDFQQALVGVALMKEDWQLQLDGEGKVLFQDFFLLGARRKITVEVQSAFTHRADAVLLEQILQVPGTVGGPVAGAVGVDTGGGKQSLPVFVEVLAEFERLFAALDAGTGHHQLADPGFIGALKHGLVFVGETGVGQVDADIDELHGATSAQRAESISEL